MSEDRVVTEFVGFDRKLRVEGESYTISTAAILTGTGADTVLAAFQVKFTAASSDEEVIAEIPANDEDDADDATGFTKVDLGDCEAYASVADWDFNPIEHDDIEVKVTVKFEEDEYSEMLYPSIPDYEELQAAFIAEDESDDNDGMDFPE